MKRLVFLLLLLLPALPAQVVADRLAVTVDRSAITESMLRRSIQIASFLNRTELDLSPQQMRRYAERLVDQTLIRREMALMRYPTPAFPDIQKRIESIRETRQQNEAAFLAELRRYGLTREDLEEEVEWILTLLRFLDFRFRPAVEVSEEEVAQALEQTKPPAQEAATPPEKLDDVRTEIRALVNDKKMSAAMEQWLQLTRKQVRIEFREEVFR